MKRIIFIIIILCLLPLVAFAEDGMIDLITSQTQQYAVPAQTKPDYLDYYIDPTFGTRVYRITGDPGTTVYNQSEEAIGTWPDVCRKHYNQFQVWNADESKIALTTCNIGDNNVVILDGNTYAVIGTENVPWEHRWHPTDPNLFIYTTSTALRTYDIRDDSTALVKDFSSVCTSSMDLDGKGNVTEDYDRIALQCYRGGADNDWYIFAYDIGSDTIFPGFDVGSTENNWVSISQNGAFINRMNGDEESYSHTASTGLIDQTYAHDISHYDMCVDTSGNQVAAGIGKPDWGACDAGTNVMIDMDDGTVTCLNQSTDGNAYGGLHSSCRNTDLPGWVYSSFSTERVLYTDEIVATKLDGSGDVRRFCHVHSSGDAGYDYEVQPTVSRDGRRVMFTSDWDSTPRYAQTYIVDAIARAPIDGVSFGDGL